MVRLQSCVDCQANPSFLLSIALTYCGVLCLQVEEKPDVTYNDVGGCKEQIEKLKEVVETPLLHVSTIAACSPKLLHSFTLFCVLLLKGLCTCFHWLYQTIHLVPLSVLLKPSLILKRHPTLRACPCTLKAVVHFYADIRFTLGVVLYIHSWSGCEPVFVLLYLSSSPLPLGFGTL